MAHFAHVTSKRLQVKDTSKTCSVPDDAHAKLMYYLHCVEGVKCGDFPAYMINYASYRQLSQAQKSAIVAMARRHDPDEVLCFVEVDELPDNNGNKFLQLSSQQESLTAFGIHGVAGQAMMGLQRQLGESEDLVKIMAHTKGWARNNYYQPLRQLMGSGAADASSVDSAALALAMLFRALRSD